MKDLDFELLLVEDQKLFWNVVGITYASSPIPDSRLSTLRASLFAVEKAKKLLGDGKKICVSKQTRFSEVQPDEIIEQDLDALNSYRQCALNEINAKMHQTIIGVSVMDAMQYLTNYLKLVNAGFIITDENREDKYFEVIEQAQQCEEPAPLSDSSTFDDEQKYMEDKAKYDKAQDNLKTLEKYLNAYDNLQKIYNTTEIMQTAKDKIKNAATTAEIDAAKSEYSESLKKFDE